MKCPVDVFVLKSRGATSAAARPGGGRPRRAVIDAREHQLRLSNENRRRKVCKKTDQQRFYLYLRKRPRSLWDGSVAKGTGGQITAVICQVKSLTGQIMDKPRR